MSSRSYSPVPSELSHIFINILKYRISLISRELISPKLIKLITVFISVIADIIICRRNVISERVL